MDFAPPQRQRLPRETRLLLTTALLAVIALWVLARLRFQEPSPAAGAVGPMLAPLMVRPAFDELAAQIAETSRRVDPSLFSVPLVAAAGAVGESRVSALRLHDDIALMLLPQGAVLSERAQVELIAEDPPTGLTLVRTIQARAPVRDDSWIRHEVPSPRFLMRSDPYSAISLRPFYAAALSESNAPLWSTALWQLPQGTDVKPGSFVFTGDGEWVGLTVAHDAGTAVVPADALVSFSRRLLERSNGPRGTLGIEVQPLMPALRTLTGARSGVVVTYVAPPASIDGVKIADVLESADGRPLPTIEHWQRFLADLEVDVPVVIHLRRAHAETDVTLVPKAQTAALEMASLPSPVKPKPPAHAVRPLGLELRTIARAGAEVVTVQPASLGAIAGLRVGDVITMVGALPRPTAAQVQRAARAAESQPLLLAVQRGDSHRLVALEP